MKKTLFFLLVMFSMTQLMGQEDKNFKVPLIGDTAPAFSAETTTGTIDFPSSFGNKWKILLSHPQDYTPVCSSELLELANMQKDFEDLNVKLVVVSTDKLETHFQWIKSLEELRYKDRVTQKIKFPLVDDNIKAVARLYGMIHPSTNSSQYVRGVYIIDNNNIIQSISFYPMIVGRNMEEIKRTVIALQTAKEGKVSTPANWMPGEDIIVPYRSTSKKDVDENGLYDVAWYMTFKKI